ncbi:MAG: glucose 1-dehydrogenase [Actinobacteria bacterium]|nr:glucose 1-dehydrogenase [Actinomycetota bacterium]
MTGTTTIITGAGSGMGRASVERFLAEGGNVVAVDIRDEGLAELRSIYGDEHLLTATCDAADQAAVNDVVQQTLDRFGAVDVYFNNAGVPFVAKPIEEVTDEEWDLNMTVNLKAIFIAARAVVPVMKKQGGGKIIVTASMAGLRPRPNLGPYTVAKGGATHFAKALAIELAPANIRVNAVCPVAADTPMLPQFGAGDHITANATPLGRLCSAEDVAAAALYLASDDGNFITGLAIPVDGGRSI